MNTITLKRLEINNFKGLSALDVDFGETTQIIGANGTGKTTIHEAFTWCLFGTDAQGCTSFTVRPLDVNNNLVPDLEVKVSATLDCNGQQTVFTRILAAGKKDNAATYCVNGVPCKMSEFDEKLNAICKKEDLKLLTSVSAFFGLDTKSARARLQQISSAAPVEEVAASFPAVLAAFKEGKTADELKREVAARKAKASDRLKQIPTAITAQEELRPQGLDFDSLRKEAVKKEGAIAAIDAKLQKETTASQPEFEAAQADRAKLNDLKTDLLECEASIEREYRTRKADIETDRSTDTSALAAKQREVDALGRDVAAMNMELASYNKELSDLSTTWDAVNQTAFSESVEPVCPTCKKPYTAAELGQMQNSLLEQFNQHKLSQLTQIEAQAKNKQDAKKAINFNIAESNAQTAVLNKEIADLQAEIARNTDRLVRLPAIDLAKKANTEWAKLTQDIEQLSAKIATTAKTKEPTDDSELSTKKIVLQKELAEINKELGKESLNAEIDKRKAGLLAEEKTLAQAVADCDNVEAQIKAFNKRRIEMVEEAVASLFQIVRFKMYEPNLTNDGEREICECLVDGVPLTNLNTAKRVNAGIDIINGFSRALGVATPIFVDGKESVTELIETGSQLITFAVVEGAQLTITK